MANYELRRCLLIPNVIAYYDVCLENNSTQLNHVKSVRYAATWFGVRGPSAGTRHKHTNAIGKCLRNGKCIEDFLHDNQLVILVLLFFNTRLLRESLGSRETSFLFKMSIEQSANSTRHEPTVLHMQVATRNLKYLAGTAEKGIKYIHTHTHATYC